MCVCIARLEIGQSYGEMIGRDTDFAPREGVERTAESAGGGDGVDPQRVGDGK